MAGHLRNPDDAQPPPGVEERRLKIYRELVYNNIEGFISSTFPILRSLHDDADWTLLVRDFIRQHRCESPLFLEISQEFLAFLGARDLHPERPFAAELAHYEWLELAVDVAEGAVPAAPQQRDPGSSTARLPATARLGVYHFPVHRIGASFQPREAGEPTALLVYRTHDDSVQFSELNAATGQLISEIAAGGAAADGATVASLLCSLADRWGANRDSLLSFGSQQLLELADRGAMEWLPLPGH